MMYFIKLKNSNTTDVVDRRTLKAMALDVDSNVNDKCKHIALKLQTGEGVQFVNNVIVKCVTPNYKDRVFNYLHNNANKTDRHNANPSGQ